MKKIKNIFILDACCGSRMFWFNKKHPNCIYVDNRKEILKLSGNRGVVDINPDQIMDFRDLKFSDKSFKLVVFDPPHYFANIKSVNTSDLTKKYGFLERDTWPEDIKKGFDECWRVLEDYGTLIFKWNETAVSVPSLLKTINKEPLFGQRLSNKTIWLCFMKIPQKPN